MMISKLFIASVVKMIAAKSYTSVKYSDYFAALLFCRLGRKVTSVMCFLITGIASVIVGIVQNIGM